MVEQASGSKRTWNPKYKCVLTSQQTCLGRMPVLIARHTPDMEKQRKKEFIVIRERTRFSRCNLLAAKQKRIIYRKGVQYTQPYGCYCQVNREIKNQTRRGSLILAENSTP